MGSNGTLKDIFRSPRRTAWIGMRVLADDKASIKRAAKAVRRSMTGYLLALHAYAVNGGKP
jgi:uncharacterized protein (DUF1778 family)